MEAVVRPTLAQIFRRFFRRFRQEHDLTSEQRKAAWCIQACRTPALGGVELQCDHCEQTRTVYCSCGNRHCPQCQAAKSAQWLEQQERWLLPVPYFHVVFTVPCELHLVFRYNRRLLYGLLFQVSSWTLQKFAADPKWLGARIGFLGVLHTWGQSLIFHPHLHYIVPQGGLDEQGQWVEPKPEWRGKFLFPVLALSQVFRGRLLAQLEKLHQQGRLRFPDVLSETAFPDRLRIAASKDWEVYAKKPFAGPGAILKYLGRYTHRVAISQKRLLGMDRQNVEIEYQDYRQHGERKTLRLRGEEFLRRFLEHVLPEGFRRIRSYGFWANRKGREKIVEVREQLLQKAAGVLGAAAGVAVKEPAAARKEPEPRSRCPHCGEGTLCLLRKLEPVAWDSS